MYCLSGQVQTEKQKEIVAAFKHGWTAYKKYAWGHDELHPISKTYSEWFGTGLTLVDALDTMVIMGLKEGSPGSVYGIVCSMAL